MHRQNRITNFSIDLLKRVLTMCKDGYYFIGKIKPEQCLQSRTKSSKYKPVYYIFEERNALFIIIRGSQSISDAYTDLDIDEFTNLQGHSFHSGFYRAAYDIFEESYDIVSTHDLIYVSGHSLGGSVATVLHYFLCTTFPNKDINTIAYDPAPSVADNVFDDHMQSKLATIIYRHEIVSSLSCSNVHSRIKWADPILSRLNPNMIYSVTRFCTGWIPIGRSLFDTIENASHTISSALRDEANGQSRSVKHVQGCIYRITGEQQRTLEELRIDPKTLKWNFWNPIAYLDHLPYTGEYILDGIEED
ncbi:putative lipase containing protein [Histomonas meleagridis]|uniref:putative lipase containing protein n=1 Tax=Histomonas meleagridis TaxID=135588 RepID=UPI00355AA5D6|nr:putative lipase containing protein [Histomonas meleagridis]KAH0802289.1 putative lipase containing protein [Histomonas meleagridis]